MGTSFRVNSIGLWKVEVTGEAEELRSRHGCRAL